jgi:hypothetical protein
LSVAALVGSSWDFSPGQSVSRTAMERKKINTAFDDHDFDQLVMLAKVNKIKLTELMRRIVKAYLDNGKANLRKEHE